MQAYFSICQHNEKEKMSPTGELDSRLMLTYRLVFLSCSILQQIPWCCSIASIIHICFYIILLPKVAIPDFKMTPNLCGFKVHSWPYLPASKSQLSHWKKYHVIKTVWRAHYGCLWNGDYHSSVRRQTLASSVERWISDEWGKTCKDEMLRIAEYVG